MNKVRSTVKHMPRKAKLLTALLACVLVLTLIGVGIAAEVESGTKFFRGTTIKICDNQIGVTTNALDWTDKHNFDKFSVNEAGTWTHENATKITGSVESWYDGAMVPAKTAITLQNLSDNKAVVFSFDYKEEYSGFQQCRGYVKIGSEDATTGKGSYTVTLQPKQSISVSISTTQYNREVAEGAIPKETIELSNFSVAATDQKSITLKPAANGSYTVKSGNQSETVTAQDENKTFSYKSTDGITVTATPNKGYKFALLRDDDTPLTTNAGENSATVYPNGNVLSALFVEDSQKAPFHIERENEDESYYYWEDAMRASVAKNNAPVVMDIDNQGRTYSLPTSSEEIGLSKNKYVITNEDGKVEYTIPADVTLVVPYSAAHSVSGNNMVNTDASSGEFHHEGVTASVGTAYATLTVPEGTALSVNGTLLIDALQGGKNGQPYTSCVVGNYGKMIVGGTVKVNTGGTLYAYGYVVDKNHTQENHVGKIDVSGGTLTQMLQIADWRGGHYGVNCNKNNYNVFPFSIYYLQNNMVPTTYSYGSAMKARAAIAGGGTVMYDTVSVIGNGEEKNPSIFDMAAGATVETDYSYLNDQLLVKLIGDTSMNCLKLKAGNQASMDTKNMELAISDNMQITVSGGTMAINYGLKFLPGASLTVEENGNLNITASNGRAFFYGKDDYIDAFAYGKWRTRLQGEGIIDKPGQTIKPTKDAELNLKGGLTISGDLALSSNHSGLTPGSKAATVTVNKILPPDTYLLEPCKDNYLEGSENNTNTAYGMPDLTNGLSYVAITSFSEKNKDTIEIVGWHNILAIQNKNWTGPKGVMADGTSAAVMNAASPANTYKACEKNAGSLAWYNRVVTCDYSNKDIPATKLYIGSQTASVKAPEMNGTKYVITGITTGNTGIAYANGGGDANAISDGVTSVKLSNIVQAENALTATVKSYAKTVTWTSTNTGTAESQTNYTYLASGENEATLTYNEVRSISPSDVSITDANGIALSGASAAVKTENKKTSVTVSGITSDAKVSVPYSAGPMVTWKVTKDGTTSETTVYLKDGENTATYTPDKIENGWLLVTNVHTSNTGVSIDPNSANENAPAESVTVSNVTAPVMVELTLKQFDYKVTQTVTTFDEQGGESTGAPVTKYTNDKTWTYTPSKQHIIGGYDVTNGTVKSGNKNLSTKMASTALETLSVTLAKGKEATVSVTDYAYRSKIQVKAQTEEGEQVPQLSYTEYATYVDSGETDEMENTLYTTLRPDGTKGKYWCESFPWGVEGALYFEIPADQKYAMKYLQMGEYFGTKNYYVGFDSLPESMDLRVTVIPYTHELTIFNTADASTLRNIYVDSKGVDAATGKAAVYDGWYSYLNKQFISAYQVNGDVKVNGSDEKNVTDTAVGSISDMGDYFQKANAPTGLKITDIKGDATIQVTFTPFVYGHIWKFTGLTGGDIVYPEFVMEKDGKYIGAVDKRACPQAVPHNWEKIENYGQYTAPFDAPENYYIKNLNNEGYEEKYINPDRRGGKVRENSTYGTTDIIALAPYTASLAYTVDGVTTYMYVNDANVEDNYKAGGYDAVAKTWTYTVPTGQTVAPNGLNHNYCDAVYEGGKVTVSGLTANSTVSITTSTEASTDADTYYMGDMSFEYVRNAAAFTWDGKEGTTGSWKPVNAFGWRHAVGSKSYEVGGKTLTVDNGSILFVNNTDSAVTYNVWLSRPGAETYGVSLDFDDPGDAVTVNNGAAAVTVQPNEQVTLVCRMTGTPNFSGGSEIEIGTIKVTKN